MCTNVHWLGEALTECGATREEARNSTEASKLVAALHFHLSAGIKNCGCRVTSRLRSSLGLLDVVDVNIIVILVLLLFLLVGVVGGGLLGRLGGGLFDPETRKTR